MEVLEGPNLNQRLMASAAAQAVVNAKDFAKVKIEKSLEKWFLDNYINATFTNNENGRELRRMKNVFGTVFEFLQQDHRQTLSTFQKCKVADSNYVSLRHAAHDALSLALSKFFDALCTVEKRNFDAESAAASANGQQKKQKTSTKKNCFSPNKTGTVSSLDKRLTMDNKQATLELKPTSNVILQVLSSSSSSSSN